MTLLDLDSARATGAYLPEPARARWQPTRAGLVDLFHYDYEEFHFRDGHLLLRGNNGTGKSKVLALMLPFLLDGDISAHRVEPDGDPGKRMEWNLLLGGRYPERTGYTWLEFGRIGDDGAPRFTTLGIGLRAVAGRPVDTWFFVTDQRIGADLFLVSPGRSPLRRDALTEAVGDRGLVVTTAERYRRAVNEALFDLSPDRYDALLSLLVQLRQPALSKRPDEKRLSAALTEALPPLDSAVVVDVAEAFRSLEEEKAALLSLTEARDTAVAFLGTYRTYARIAARRRAAESRTAQSAYEETGRRLAAARAELERARGAETDVVARLAAVASEQEQARRAGEVLRASPEMRSAQELHRLQTEATQTAARAEKSQAEVVAAEAELARRHAALRSAADELGSATADAAAALATAGEAAVAGRLPAPAGELTERPAVELAIGRQCDAVEHLRQLIDAVSAADHALRQAERWREESAAERDRAVELRDQAHAVAVASGEDLVAAARRAVTALAEIRLPDPEATLDRLRLWCETLDGDQPLAADVGLAARRAIEQLARSDTRLAADQETLQAERARLDEERQRLEAGEEVGPPASTTRDTAGRATRPGAPLWQLVDFADGLGDADKAGLEAALEASGLLDGWVTPDGTLLDADDAVLQPGDGAAIAAVSTVLRPAVSPEATVPAAAVAVVLEGIGLGEGSGDTWVDASGRYRLGVLQGRWHKPTAQYVGAGARAAARRTRLLEITAAVARLDEQLSRLGGERQALELRRTAVDAEVAALPVDRPLRDAVATEQGRVTALAECEGRLVQREQEVVSAQGALSDRQQDCAADAEATGLPATDDGLRAVAEGLGAYQLALAALWPALGRQERAVTAEGVATAETQSAQDVLIRRARESEEARVEADGALAARDALQATVGAAVAEVQRRLHETEGETRRLRVEAERLVGERLELAGAVGAAQGSERELEARLSSDAEARQRAVEGLRAFASTGLLAVALPELDIPTGEWAPTPAVLLARAVEGELSGVDDSDPARDRATRHLQEQLTVLGEVLSRAGDVLASLPTEHGIVVTATWRGREVPVGELAGGLDTELADRERLLSAKERTLLENHLVSDVAARLQELILAAEAKVADMNRELADRPTSTGMQLRFVWTPRSDGPTGLAEVRQRLLRQQSDAWDEDDRTAVGEFLQQQISHIRTLDPAGTWSDHLREALDYRAWHGFGVELRQDGRWRSASGPASGGERVLAATIPLFAAASSHYASAGSAHAPRLVLLDEAFAGVDDDSRAKCLGLLATFDLDYVLTSEREWGCYPSVPGLAISQLSRRDGIDAVLVTRWEWDGQARTAVDRELPPMMAPE